MIAGKAENKLIRDYTFLTKIEERKNSVLKIIYRGTEEKITKEKKEIADKIYFLVDKKALRLGELRLEYNYVYNTRIDKELFYQAFGYCIISKTVIPVSFLEFPDIRNRYFISKRKYNNAMVNKACAKILKEKNKTIKKEKQIEKNKVKRNKMLKKQRAEKNKIKAKQVYEKPKSFLEMIKE